MNWKIERIIPPRGGFPFPIRHPIFHFHFHLRMQWATLIISENELLFPRLFPTGFATRPLLLGNPLVKNTSPCVKKMMLFF
jgi:hypothetical protein